MKKLALTLLTLGGIVTSVVFWGTPALGQPDPTCYMINSSGQVVDLSAICHRPVSPTRDTGEPTQASEFKSYSQVQNNGNMSQEEPLPNFQGYSLYSTRFPNDSSSSIERRYNRVEYRPSIVMYSKKTMWGNYSIPTQRVLLRIQN